MLDVECVGDLLRLTEDTPPLTFSFAVDENQYFGRDHSSQSIFVRFAPDRPIPFIE